MEYFRVQRICSHSWQQLLRVAVFVFAVSLCTSTMLAQESASAASVSDIQAYIAQAWTTLTRSPSDCKTVLDGRNPTYSILYFPADVTPNPAARELEQRCGIHIRQLPAVVHAAGDLAQTKFEQHGLLYLPNAYVVPGGFSL